ncbi:hypothetical protein HPB47_014238 [Ixodes persulcatus]|uniref:Uncharacterized protein n=1 Tax=Ixodes persulcatus TaxID=34615 RepID=A0AC60QYD5_IXOPE|nr:hypothetical protein HPB47_014238 [Ixodes persulcatus]
MAADDGRGTYTSELSFAVPVNLSSFEREILDRSRELGFIPYDTPDHQADLHEDVAEPSPLLVAEDIARANVKHEILALEICDRALYGSVDELTGFVRVVKAVMHPKYPDIKRGCQEGHILPQLVANEPVPAPLPSVREFPGGRAPTRRRHGAPKGSKALAASLERASAKRSPPPGSKAGAPTPEGIQSEKGRASEHPRSSTVRAQSQRTPFFEPRGKTRGPCAAEITGKGPLGAQTSGPVAAPRQASPDAIKSRRRIRIRGPQSGPLRACHRRPPRAEAVSADGCHERTSGGRRDRGAAGRQSGYDDIEAIRLPHEIRLEGCKLLVVVPGRAPVCLLCRRTGHIRRDCRVPRCSDCHLNVHEAEDCIKTYAMMASDRRRVAFKCAATVGGSPSNVLPPTEKRGTPAPEDDGNPVAASPERNSEATTRGQAASDQPGSENGDAGAEGGQDSDMDATKTGKRPREPASTPARTILAANQAWPPLGPKKSGVEDFCRATLSSAVQPLRSLPVQALRPGAPSYRRPDHCVRYAAMERASLVAFLGITQRESQWEPCSLKL